MRVLPSRKGYTWGMIKNPALTYEYCILKRCENQDNSVLTIFAP